MLKPLKKKVTARGKIIIVLPPGRKDFYYSDFLYHLDIKLKTSSSKFYRGYCSDIYGDRFKYKPSVHLPHGNPHLNRTGYDFLESFLDNIKF